MLHHVGGALYCCDAFDYRNSEVVAIHLRFEEFVLNGAFDLGIGGGSRLRRIFGLFRGTRLGSCRGWLIRSRQGNQNQHTHQSVYHRCQTTLFCGCSGITPFFEGDISLVADSLQSGCLSGGIEMNGLGTIQMLMHVSAGSLRVTAPDSFENTGMRRDCVRIIVD